MKTTACSVACILRTCSFLSLLFVVAQPAAADDSDVLLIEETWELQVGGPDVDRTAPQVTMIMSPTDNLDGDYFAFEVNHWSLPDFAPGGYQLQRWYGGNHEQSLNGWKTNSLSHDGELVTWVQRLSIASGLLKFQVLNGSGESWPSFGGEGFQLAVPTALTKLNGYRPAISLGQSGIGFAGNRVSSLTLSRIYWVTADGQEHELVAPIDIDADLDP